MRLALSAFLAFCLAAPASAGNLVGTWLGRFSCTTEDANGRGKLSESTSTLLISQPGGPGGTTLRLTIDGEPYTGSIIPSAGNPTEQGVGAFVACGTSDAEGTGSFNEIELIRWKVEDGGVRGSIRKAGVFVTKGQQIGACKGGWVRSSTTDPSIAACP